ncbi:hypothetical protein ES703_45237 [subsurface metagenome]
MRTKDEILSDSLSRKSETPGWELPASIHEHLTIEVLIDIRDELNSLYSILCSVENISFRPR